MGLFVRTWSASPMLPLSQMVIGDVNALGQGSQQVRNSCRHFESPM
jgi:hypothetical protein